MSTGAAWDEVSETYSSTAATFTSLFARDLVQALHPYIKTARTILDVACGTGVFEKEYLALHPNGIPGQTIITTDFAPNFVEIAKSNVERLKAPGCQTEFKFQVEDGSILEGLQDGQVDIVVSVFGIFLIPDRDAAFKKAKRVLRKDGIFAMTTWTEVPDPVPLEQNRFGLSLQTMIEKFVELMIPPEKRSVGPHKVWFEPARCEELLTSYGLTNPVIHRTVHSFFIPDMETVWNLLTESSPGLYTIFKSKPEEENAKAKEEIRGLFKGDDNMPKLFFGAGNVMVAHSS